MREAEEQCCDAWVVWALPQAVRDYLTAVLETVDFLSEDAQPLPVPASGVGQFKHLQQRFARVLDGSPPKASSWWGKALVLILAAVLLPLVPTIARQGVEESSAAAQEPATDAAVGAGAEESQEVNRLRVTDPIRFETTPANIQGKPHSLWRVVFSPDGQFVATAGGQSDAQGEVTLWNVAEQKPATTFTEDKGIRSVAISPDGKLVAYASYTLAVTVREIATGDMKFQVKGHTNYVECVTFSPDGKTLATAGADRTIRQWETATGRPVRTLSGHSNTVGFIVFSADSKNLLSGSLDQTARLWDVDNGRQLRLFNHGSPVGGVAFSPDGAQVATAGQNGTVMLWDRATARHTSSLVGHQGHVIAVAFSPDGRTLATGGQDDTVRLWDPATGRQLRMMSGHQNNVFSVDFARDGRRLATAGWDNTTRIWDVASGKLLHTLRKDVGLDEDALPVLLLAHAPDGSTIATVHVSQQDDSPQQVVRIRDAKSGEFVRLLKGHEDLIRGLAYSPDGKTLATASYDKTVKLWDAATGKVKATLAGHDRWAVTVGFSSDGKTLASGGYDRALCIWDVTSGKRKAKFQAHGAAIQSVALSPDGKLLATGSSDRKIKLWDTTSWKLVGELASHKNSVRVVAFSPDSALLASGGADKALKIWDVQRRTEKATLFHTDVISSLAFSPGGGTLATASYDRTVRTWDVAKANPMQTLAGHTLAVTGVAFAHDGSALYSVSLDNTIKRWPVARPPVPPLAVIPRDDLQVFALDVSPDGRLLATAGKNREIRIRNATSGELLQTLRGLGGGVLCTQFFSDSRRLASSSYDGKVRLWDVQTGKLLTSYEAYTGDRAFVRKLRIASDGKLIVSGNEAGVVMFWDVEQEKIIRSLPKEQMPITDVAFSPDGNTLVVTSGNWREWQRPGRLTVWDAKTGKLRIALQHPAEVRGAKFSPNAKRLVSFGPREAKVWDTATWRQVGSLPGTIKAMTYLRDNKTIAIGQLKGQMALLNAETGQTIARFQGHDNLVSSITCSPRGAYLVSGCHYGWVKLWPTGQGDVSGLVHGWGRRVQSHYGLGLNGGQADHVAVQGLRYDGKHPITLEAIVSPRTLENGSVIADFEQAGIGLHLWRDGFWKFNVHDGQKHRVASSDAKAVIGKRVHLVGLFDGSNVKLFVDGRLQKKTDRAAKVKPSGRPFYVGANPRPNGSANEGFDGRIDAVRISKVARYAKDFEPPKAFDRDDKTLVLYHLAEGAGALVRDASGLGHNGHIIGGTWQNLLGGTGPRTLTAAATLTPGEGDVWVARFSPDGKRVATGGNDKIVRMWDAASRKTLWQAKGHSASVACAAFSRDGKNLATGSWDRTIRVWKSATGKLITSLEGHTGEVRGLVFARDGRLVSCGEDKQAIVWDISSGRASKKMPHDLPVYSVDLSPDGKRLATGTGNWKEKKNGIIRLWDVDTGKMVTTLKGSAGLITSLAFTPGGGKLVAANAGAGVAVWDTNNRALVASLWPDRTIRPIAISRDGQRIAAGMRNGKRCWARVWNARTGNLEAICRGHEKMLFSTDFSPDGTRLVTASGDGTVRFWDLGKSAALADQPAAAAASGRGGESPRPQR